MGKKGKLWSKLFKRKHDEDEHENSETRPDHKEQYKIEDEEPSLDELDITGEELPKDTCRLCYEPFISGDLSYTCRNCDGFYHFPRCLRGQSNCRVCGEKITEKGNIVRVVKFKSVVCPKCGMKIKLVFDTGPKLQVDCPSCGHEGHLPNPYLSLIKKYTDDDAEPEPDVEHDDEQEQEQEQEPEFESEIELDEDVEDWDDMESDMEGDDEEITIDLETKSKKPKIIRPGSPIKKRKAKLVVLEQSITCNVCLGIVKTKLPVVVCRCGKKYHEACATRVGECPTCDGDLCDIERLVEVEEPSTEAEAEPELEPIPEPMPEPEPVPEPELMLGSELESELNFDNFKRREQNIIFRGLFHKIAEAPGKEFNLIYVHGPDGSGKTHILHAIGNYILDDDPKSKVRFTSTKQLFSELNQALELNKLEDFEDFYNEADVLLLDDLQDMPKRKAEQEIFFKIFDNLMQNKKQLVLVADQSIEEINGLNKKMAQKIISKCGLIIRIRSSFEK